MLSDEKTYKKLNRDPAPALEKNERPAFVNEKIRFYSSSFVQGIGHSAQAYLHMEELREDSMDAVLGKDQASSQTSSQENEMSSEEENEGDCSMLGRKVPGQPSATVVMSRSATGRSQKCHFQVGNCQSVPHEHLCHLVGPLVNPGLQPCHLCHRGSQFHKLCISQFVQALYACKNWHCMSN